jgi:hypothetical protein
MAGSEQEESTRFIQHLAGGFEERRVGLHCPDRDEICPVRIVRLLRHVFKPLVHDSRGRQSDDADRLP